MREVLMWKKMETGGKRRGGGAITVTPIESLNQMEETERGGGERKRGSIFWELDDVFRHAHH